MTTRKPGKKTKTAAVVEKFEQDAVVTAGGGVRVTSLKWEPWDDRSYGTLEYEAETPHGHLEVFTHVASHELGGTGEEKYTLDGEDLDEPGELVDEVEGNLSAKSSDARVKKIVEKAITMWAESYKPVGEPSQKKPAAKPEPAESKKPKLTEKMSIKLVFDVQYDPDMVEGSAEAQLTKYLNAITHILGKRVIDGRHVETVKVLKVHKG